MEIKNRIKQSREEMGLTQQAFADALNKIIYTDDDPKIYAQTVSYWENGRDPSINALIKICRLTGLSPEFFLGTQEEDTLPKYMYTHNRTLFSTENLIERLSNYTDKSKNEVIDKINEYLSAIYWNDFSNDSEKFNSDDIARIYLYASIVQQLNEYVHSMTNLDLMTNRELEELKERLEERGMSSETPKIIAGKLSRVFEARNKLQGTINLLEKWFTSKYRTWIGTSDLNGLVDELKKHTNN